MMPVVSGVKGREMEGSSCLVQETDTALASPLVRRRTHDTTKVLGSAAQALRLHAWHRGKTARHS